MPLPGRARRDIHRGLCRDAFVAPPVSVASPTSSRRCSALAELGTNGGGHGTAPAVLGVRDVPGDPLRQGRARRHAVRPMPGGIDLHGVNGRSSASVSLGLRLGGLNSAKESRRNGQGLAFTPLSKSVRRHRHNHPLTVPALIAAWLQPHAGPAPCSIPQPSCDTPAAHPTSRRAAGDPSNPPPSRGAERTRSP